MRNVIQYALAAAILQAQLNWEALASEAEPSTLLYAKLVLYSATGLLVQGVVTFGIMNRSMTSIYQVCLALILPLSFSLVTFFVLVWENTSTVRILGKLLETMYQCTAIMVLGGGIDRFLVGLLSRVGLCLVFSNLFRFPCSMAQESYCIAAF